MKNRLGIENDPEALRVAERIATSSRAETVFNISGGFDEQHLRDIHRHIFQDVYEWAGSMRQDTIELDGETVHVPDVAGLLSKGNSTFLSATDLDRGLRDIARLSDSTAARSPDRASFADAATEILAKLNHAHPFREGNGRTQRAFMEQLAERAGHRLDFEGVTSERNINASVEAFHGKTDALHRIVTESLDPDRVSLRLDAIAALERTGIQVDQFHVETVAPGDQVQGTLIDKTPSHASVVDTNNRIFILPESTLNHHMKSGDVVNLQIPEDQSVIKTKDHPYIEHVLAHTSEDRVNPPFDNERDRVDFVRELREALHPEQMEALRSGDVTSLENVLSPALTDAEQHRLALACFDYGGISPYEGVRNDIISRLSDVEYAENDALRNVSHKHI